MLLLIEEIEIINIRIKNKFTLALGSRTVTPFSIILLTPDPIFCIFVKRTFIERFKA